MTGSALARLEGRNGQVWAAYVSGITQTAIAERFGITQARVSQIVAQVQESIPPEDRRERWTRHLEALDRMRSQAIALVEAPLPPLYSAGRPVLDEDGRMVEDTSGRLAAMREARAFLEREAKLLGLDQPDQVEVVTVQAPVGLQARIATLETLLAYAERHGHDMASPRWQLIRREVAALELGEVQEADRLHGEAMSAAATSVAPERALEAQEGGSDV